MSRTTFIHADRAEARASNRFFRVLGWLALIGALVWLTVNLTSAGATLNSWTLEQTVWPAFLAGGAALILRGSADERLEFDRTTRTVRRSSQFRTRVKDLSGVQALFWKHSSLRDWLGKYWRREVSWSQYNLLPSDEFLLLEVVTELFNEALLNWWLN